MLKRYSVDLEEGELKEDEPTSNRKVYRLDSSRRGIPSDRLSGGTGTIEGTFTAPAFVEPVTKIFIIPDLSFRVQKRMSEKSIEGVVLLTLLHPPYESGSQLTAPVPEATHHHVSQACLRRVQGSPDLQKSMI